MSDKYEDHRDDAFEPLTDGEAREFEKVAAPYRALMAAITEVRIQANRIGSTEMRCLTDMIADAVANCAPLNALIDYDTENSHYEVRAAVDAVNADAIEAMRKRPVMAEAAE